MGGIFGGDGRTQAMTPAGPEMPYLRRGYGALEQQVFGPLDPSVAEARQRMIGMGLGGTPYQRAGEAELAKTLGGEYLYGGPGFEAALGAAERRIVPSVASQFERFGRHGSPAEMGEAASRIADVFAQQYGAERQRQLGALGMIPGMQAAGIRGLGLAERAGLAPRRDIEEYLQAIGRPTGREVTTTGGMGTLGRLASGGLGGYLMGAFAPESAGLSGPLGLGLGLLGGALGQ